MSSAIEETKLIETLERRVKALEHEASEQWLRGAADSRNVWVTV